MKKLLLLGFCCLLWAVSLAQSEQDTLSREQRDTQHVKKDTTTKIVPDTSQLQVPTVPSDTVRVAKPPVTQNKPDDGIPEASVLKGPPIPAPRPSLQGYEKTLLNHPYFNFYGKGVLITEQLKKASHDEGMFYFLLCLLFYFGLFRIIFIKYLDNLNTLFFRVTMRQNQIREQLLQSPLPSLFLNILFVVSTGLFLSFVADYYNIVPGMNRWLLLLYCCLLVTIVYMGKFILLKMVGWMFNIRVATDTYIFIVFLVNKMMGIYLLPALLLMAFSKPPFLTVLITLTYVFILVLFIYRFIIAYRPIRNEIKLTRFHFFIYLCAFEIAPLLLIYKVLLIFVERSY